MLINIHSQAEKCVRVYCSCLIINTIEYRLLHYQADKFDNVNAGYMSVKFIFIWAYLLSPVHACNVNNNTFLSPYDINFFVMIN